MSILNREERQTLRSVQMHLYTSILRAQAVHEQIGTVDVYFHASNPAPHLNCVIPHKGVAWIRHADLRAAFMGLERLGRIPRLLILDALFPDAFKQQLSLMELSTEDERLVMVYQPMLGPDLPEETPRGRIPHTFGPSIQPVLATTPAELATWLRIFRAGYYNSEALSIEPGAIDPLLAGIEAGEFAFVIANYETTPLGAARVSLRPPTAELEAVVTTPLWHGMGLEEALISTGTQTALERGCEIVFTIAPTGDYTRLYRRLGFVELTHMTTYWRADDYAQALGRIAPKGASNDVAEPVHPHSEP